jgi:outer membrane immunogenic protein
MIAREPEMRKLLSAVAVGCALLAAAPAGAADLLAPAPAPVAVAPAFTWTGWYVGANAGGGWKTGSVDPTCSTPGGLFSGGDCTLIPRVNEHGGGFIGGGQLGYNWQSGSWVVGLETDIQGSDIRSRSTVHGPFGIVGGGTTAPGAFWRTEERLDWLGTTRARVGFTPAERVLLYATGGFAYGGVKTSSAYDDGLGGVAFSSHSGTRGGWTVGAGAEYAVTDNVSLRIEGLWFDLGSTTVQGPGLTAAGTPNGFVSGGRFRNEGALVRGAVNIKSDGLFGWRLW